MGIVTLIIAISAIIFDIVLTIVLAKMWRKFNGVEGLIGHIIITGALLSAKVDSLAIKLEEKAEPEAKPKYTNFSDMISDVSKSIRETIRKTNEFFGASNEKTD